MTRRQRLLSLGVIVLLTGANGSATPPVDDQQDWGGNATFFDIDANGWPFRNASYEFFEIFGGTFVEISPMWSVCGGMSLSAKKRFLAGNPIEPFSETVKQELIDNQWETVGGKIPEVGATFLWWMSRPDAPHMLDKQTIGAATKEQWGRITTSIDMGFPVVLGLVLVGPTWHGLPVGLWDVGENHQVLAIGYAFNDRTMDRRIFVYDPNHPGQLVTIGMNFGLPDNQIAATYGQPFGDGKRLRGLFVINDAPRCIACDCQGWYQGLCILWRADPGSTPLGYRYLGESLAALQPKLPASSSLIIQHMLQ